MRVLDCGCELSADGNHYLSLCESHGAHVRSRLEAAKHPRSTIPTADRAFERELVKILAPVVFARHPNGSAIEPETCAEKLFQCIHSITKRLE